MSRAHLGPSSPPAGRRSANRRSTNRRATDQRAATRRGFTLIEALMSSGIILVIVIALTSAVGSGQMHALEAQRQVTASLAAESLLQIVLREDYATLTTWDNFREEAGAMTDPDGEPLPAVYDHVGREVAVTTMTIELASPAVRVRGRLVAVRAFDASDRTMLELTRFVAEPAEDSLPDVGE